MTSYGVNIVNRFDLLSDEAPIKKATPAPVEVEQKSAPPKAASEHPARNNNYRGNSYNPAFASGGEDRPERAERGERSERGGRGRGRGGRPYDSERPYRPRSDVDAPRRDGETNPNKREFDHHVPRTEYSRGRGSSRGGPKRHGAGRFNAGAANEVQAEQSTEQAIEQAPMPASESGEVEPAAEAEVAEEVAEEAAAPVEDAKEEEEEDKTITLAQWQALQAQKIAEDTPLKIREAGQDVQEDDFQNAKEFKRRDIAEENVLGFVAREKPAPGQAAGKLVERSVKELPIDIVFADPSGGYRGRGGRGGRGARGGRGGYAYGSRKAPSLGK